MTDPFSEKLGAVELITDANNGCGESPLWDEARGRLLWIDAEKGAIYFLDPETHNPFPLHQNVPVSALTLTRTGELLIGGAEGLALLRETGKLTPLVREFDGETLAINDLLTDAKGRLYAGTVFFGEDGEMEKYGKLYLFHPDGTVQGMDEGIEHANGMGLSSDGRTLYFSDSTARKIFAYEVAPETGSLSNRRVLVSVPPEEGLPDGLTVDRDGYLWSAQWYGGQVVRYRPDGSVERRISLPVQQVSSVGFGGASLTDLYITTAASSWQSRFAPPGFRFDAPNIGGSLYRVRFEEGSVQGKPEPRANFS